MHDFINLTLASFPEFALTCAKTKDYDSFDASLRERAHHADYFPVCNAVCDTLLRNDELDFFIHRFNESYMQKWCTNNTAYVLENCPTVLNHWAYGFGAKHHEVFFCISGSLEKQGDRVMLSILRGQSKLVAATMLLEHVQRDAGNWLDLSPFWIGSADSQLRQEARNLGWREDFLSAMVHRSFWNENAPHWYPNVDYPYSLMACQTYQETTNWELLKIKHLPGVLSSVSGSNPLDIALAKIILALCKKTAGLSLRRTRAVPAVDAHTQKALESVVLTHLDLGAMHILESQLSFGCLPGLENPVRIQLPDLSF